MQEGPHLVLDVWNSWHVSVAATARLPCQKVRAPHKNNWDELRSLTEFLNFVSFAEASIRVQSFSRWTCDTVIAWMPTSSLVLSWPLSTSACPSDICVLAGIPLPVSAVGLFALPWLLIHDIVIHVDVCVHDLIIVLFFDFVGLVPSLAGRDQSRWTFVLGLALLLLVVFQMLPFMFALISYCEIFNFGAL